MIIGYVRMGEDEDEMSAQQSRVAQGAENLGFRIDEFYNLQNINLLKNGSLNKGDTIVIFDISDFGNRLQDVKENIQFFINKGISVYSLKEQYVFRPDRHTQNLLKGIDLAMSIRNSMVSSVTIKALSRVKHSGKKLGRKKGEKYKKLLDGHENEIRSLLRKKVPKTEIALHLNVAYATLFNYLREHKSILGEKL